MAAWPRWSEPLSTMTKTRGAFLYSGRAMTWPARSMNGVIPVVTGVEANTCPVCTSRPASSAREPRRLYSCSKRTGLPGAAGRVGGSGRGHGSAAWRRRTDPVAGPERLALVKPLVQVQDHLRPGLEVRVAGGDPRLVLPGLDRVLSQDPQDRGYRHGRWPAPGRPARAQFRAGPPGQRHPGGGGQLAGQRDHRGPVRRGDPPRAPAGAGPSARPARAGEPAPPLADRIDADAQVAAIRALGWPRAAASTICARSRSRQAVFAPWTRFFSGALARAQHHRHRSKQRHDSPRVRSQQRNPLPGTGS